MILIAYDFSNDKTRTKFAKFLKKYGRRVQYSVFKIKNSSRVLQLITKEIDHRFKKYFENTDSVLIMKVCDGCQHKAIKYGNMSYEDKDVICLE